MTRRADFDRVFAEGRRTRTRHFTLIAAQGTQGARLGMAIGRRSAARAVARNRLKRLIRETFRQAAPAPFDIIVTARPEAAHAAKSELRAELARGFEGLK